MGYSTTKPFRRAALGVLAPLFAGCASGPQLDHVGRTVTPIEDPVSDPSSTPESDAVDAAGTEDSPGKEGERPPDDVVLQAALPFRGVRTADGALLGEEALLSELAHADAICVGERHDDAHDHFAQLTTLEGLAARRRIGAFELGLGLEMFQHPWQYALDAYADGRLELDELVRTSRYEKRWGFPIQYYAPQLATAQAARADFVALNARSELTKAVAQEGLTELEPELASELPELDLESAAHRALFDTLMEGHPEGPDLDQMYVAQVVWDETMASRAVEWLAARAPARKLVILAGRAHCARPAIPERIERRGSFRVVSVLPEVVSASPPGPGAEGNQPQARELPDAVAQAPEGSSVAAELSAAYDYRFVMYKP